MVFEPDTPAAMLFLTTVRIETVELDGSGDEASHVATGFVVESARKASYLVTCRHVVESALRASLFFRPTVNRKPLYGNAEVTFDLTGSHSHWRYHPDPAVDVAMMPMDILLREVKATGSKSVPYLVPLPLTMVPSLDQREDDLDALEEVVFVGYPRGLWDKRNGFPILRRGITASPLSVDFDGEKKFLIDAPVFTGSSGSPVVRLGRAPSMVKNHGILLGSGPTFFLGILAKAQFARETAEAVGPEGTVPITFLRTMAHLGYVYRAETIIETIRAHYEPEQDAVDSSPRA